MIRDDLQDSLDRVLQRLRQLSAPHVPKVSAGALNVIKESIEGTLKLCYPDRKFVVEVESGKDGHTVEARISPCLTYVVVEVIVK